MPKPLTNLKGIEIGTLKVFNRRGRVIYTHSGHSCPTWECHCRRCGKTCLKRGPSIRRREAKCPTCFPLRGPARQAEFEDEKPPECRDELSK